jgi:hypothetical protein
MAHAMRGQAGERYLTVMESELEGWSARLHALESRVEASRVLRADIARRLEEVREASDERLGKLQVGIALAWRRFTAELGGTGSRRDGART